MQFVGIGNDSHRFTQNDSTKVLVLGGVVIPGHRGLDGNSDADVVLHAITNAISGVTGVNVLGEAADRMCLTEGIKDSSRYLRAALGYMKKINPVHLSVSIECSTPKLSKYIPPMRESIAELMGLSISHVCITATSGEGLTAVGRGEGIYCTALLTVSEA